MAAGMGFGVVSAATRQAKACPTVWPAPNYATVADSVRDLFRSLGLDPANPLGRWIQPGMTVVVKPNWVKHEFGSTVGRNVLFTHASLVRALIDAALAGDGRDCSSYVRGVHLLPGDPHGLETHLSREMAACHETA